MSDETIQIAGLISIVGMSVLSSRILIGHFWCFYGRQALVAWICLGLVIGTVRMLVLTNTIGTTVSRDYTAIAYFAAFVHLAQTLALHALAHKEEKKA